MKTTNEFYQKLKNMQAACEAQLKADAEKHFGVELQVGVGISVYNVPWDMMPEGSRTVTNENSRWKNYNEGVYKPNMNSQSRNFKIVFEDEPESSIENPASSIQP